jgi:hypothetical protein
VVPEFELDPESMVALGSGTGVVVTAAHRLPIGPVPNSIVPGNMVQLLKHEVPNRY